jgi:hypothetical protein
MLLIHRFQPETTPNSSAKHNHTVYIQTAAFLLGVPHQYDDIVTFHTLQIANGLTRYTPFDQSLENLTIEDLAWFYAKHGVTVAMADNAFSFALEWMKASKVSQPAQSEEIGE